jgi:hypothetical protein
VSADCQPTLDVSVSIGGLTLHHHDPPYTLLDFNPWVRQARADQENPRAWNDGAWSGTEWVDAVTIPLTILIRTEDGTRGTSAWLALYRDLAAAFRASSADVSLEYTIEGGDTFLIFGRPRLTEPDAPTAFRGWSLVRAVFRQLDPLVYSGGVAGEHSVILGLPSATGGLTVPVTVAFTIDATVTAGRVNITNAGNATTGLMLRIDGPVIEPRVTVQSAAGPVQLRYNDTLGVGDFLELDTRAHTAILNGTASRRGLVSGDWPLLEPGEWEVAFDAATYDPDARLTVTWRDAWLA